jgi:mRNA interferase RelE/StbE
LAWTVAFTPGAERDFKRLDRPIQQRISRFPHERVASAEDPRAIGEASKADLAGRWRYRVGD